MSLVIDSDCVGVLNYIKEPTFSKCNTVNLYSIIVKPIEVSHKVDFVDYTYCSIAKKYESILNVKKSDIIGVIIIKNAKRYFYQNFSNIGRSIHSEDYIAIRMALTDEHGTVLDH